MKLVYFILSSCISLCIPLFISFYYELSELGRFYYLIATSNVLSSICLFGAIQNYSVAGVFCSSIVKRLLIALPIIYISSADLWLVILVLFSVFEKVVSQSVYSSSKSLFIIPFLQFLAALFVLLGAYYLSVGSNELAFLRMLPYMIAALYFFEIFILNLSLKFLPSKSEFHLFISEIFVIVFDSGMITGSYLFFNTQVAAVIGFSRTCCSVGYVFYNWMMINLVNLKYFVKGYRFLLVYFLMTFVSFLLFYFRFNYVDIVSVLSILYFSSLPSIALKINSLIKISK